MFFSFCVKQKQAYWLPYLINKLSVQFVYFAYNMVLWHLTWPVRVRTPRAPLMCIDLCDPNSKAIQMAKSVVWKQKINANKMIKLQQIWITLRYLVRITNKSFGIIECIPMCTASMHRCIVETCVECVCWMHFNGSMPSKLRSTPIWMNLGSRGNTRQNYWITSFQRPIIAYIFLSSYFLAHFVKKRDAHSTVHHNPQASTTTTTSWYGRGERWKKKQHAFQCEWNILHISQAIKWH